MGAKPCEVNRTLVPSVVEKNEEIKICQQLLT
jgi:hypothetical protein